MDAFEQLAGIDADAFGRKVREAAKAAGTPISYIDKAIGPEIIDEFPDGRRVFRKTQQPVGPRAPERRVA